MGRSWDGGRWRCDRAEIEAYADATDDPNPRYRGPDAVAPPMFHVRPLIGLLKAMAADPELALDRLRLVHGEHAVTFHRLLRPGDVLALAGELRALEEKATGRVATFAIRGEVDGRLALEGTTTFFVRAASPPAREKGARQPEPEPPPPDLRVTQVVTADQATRYARASGDENPIHLDEAVARAAGLPGVILHGLCSMAFAARDLVDHRAGGDPARLRSIGVRWARPVLPGSSLALSAWDRGGGRVDFVTTDAEGRPVLVHGRAELADASAGTA